MKGTIVACDSNIEAYSNIINVKTIDILRNSNEEIYHWTSCMMLFEAEYSRKLDIPIENYIRAISQAQSQAISPEPIVSNENTANEAYANIFMNDNSITTDNALIVDVNVGKYNNNNNNNNNNCRSSGSKTNDSNGMDSSNDNNNNNNSLTNTSSGCSKINDGNRFSRNRILACRCLVSSSAVSNVKQQLSYCSCIATHLITSSLDPNGKFGVMLLSYLLKLKNVQRVGDLYLLDIEEMK